MNATAQKFSYLREGVDKTAFIDSLQHLSDQVHRMEQTLTVKVNEKIEQEFNAQSQVLQQK